MDYRASSCHQVEFMKQKNTLQTRNGIIRTTTPDFFFSQKARIFPHFCDSIRKVPLRDLFKE